MTKSIAQIAESKTNYFIYDMTGDHINIEAVKTINGNFKVTIREPNCPPKIFFENGSVKIDRLSQR